MTPSGLRVAILALYPDAGHMVPLLRIGGMLKARGIDVLCLLPPEGATLAGTFGLETKPIGPALSPIAVRASREFGARTILTSSFDVYYRDYYAAIFSQSVELVGAMLRELEARPPHLLLVDNHQFPEVFAGVGAELGVPVVYHDSTGGLHSRALALVSSVYGKPLPWSQALGILAAGSVYRLWREAACAYRFRRDGLPRATAEARQQLRRLLPKRPPGPRAHVAPTSAGVVSAASSGMAHHFATGLGLLEHRTRGMPLLPDRRTFGPILDLPAAPLPAPLERWLRAQPRHGVIYVSFGSMINLSRSRLRTLLEAFEALQAPVVWVAGTKAQLLSGLPVPRTVRIEAMLPQWSVLADDAIGLCVTHGGTGTVTECLAARKPMVVLPVMWDQPYNAQFVHELGAGVRVDWWRLRPQALAESIRTVMETPAYRHRAAAIAQELCDQGGSEAVRGFLEQVAGVEEEPGRVVPSVATLAPRSANWYISR